MFKTQSDLNDHKKIHPAGQQKPALLPFKPDPDPSDKSKPWRRNECDIYYSRECTFTKSSSSHPRERQDWMHCLQARVLNGERPQSTRQTILPSPEEASYDSDGDEEKEE